MIAGFFFNRHWSRLDELITNHPISDIIWLPHRYGNNFIRDDIISPLLKNASDSDSFKMAICAFLEKDKSPKRMKKFTYTQRKLSPYFSSEKYVTDISKILKWPKARFYTHRINISSRLGLKHACYLSFHLKNLSPYVIYFNLFVNNV